MNHDYAHCADYDEATCPQICFRGQLVRNYRDRVHTDMQGVPVSWMHLRGTTECVGVHNIATHVPIRVRTNADKLRSITDVKKMTDYLLWIYKNVLPMYTQSELGLEQWLKQPAESEDDNGET